MAEIRWSGPWEYDAFKLFCKDFYNWAKIERKSASSFVAQYDNATLMRDEMKGSGFSYSSDGMPAAGTITSWLATFQGGKLLGTAKNLKVSVASLISAFKTISVDDDRIALRKILSGNDVITTGSANDYLEGFDGKDVLIGGGGADTLWGGKGADRFVFDSIKHSRATEAGRDRISDFSRAQKDKIDLHAIDANTKQAGNQAFAFIGTQAFTKAGQLRYERDGSHLNVYGDVNGDGKADFSIRVESLSKLIKGDFFL